MKLEMRRKLAREPFPEKIRKVGISSGWQKPFPAVKAGNRRLALPGETLPKELAGVEWPPNRRSFYPSAFF